MDIREKIKDLFIKARKTVKSEKERFIEATEMIGRLGAAKAITGIRGKSKREAEFFLSTIDLGGNITDRQPTGKLMIEESEEETG